MHDAATREAAEALIAEGINDCEISRRLGVPRTTVRDWRRPRYVPVKPLGIWSCPRCAGRSRRIVLEARDYAELLGLYLGDGHITAMARAQRLRIFLDARYGNVVAETEALLQRCFPENPIRRVLFHDGREVVLDVYSRHLACVFPQHGPGKKHHRCIALEDWQQALVDEAPWDFLRGCIRSDGCAFINRTGPYEYLSYDFSNHSADILDLFEATCRGLGLRPCRYARSVRLNRRADVARLVEHVGLKT
jgi:Homeodomain-like domain